MNNTVATSTMFYSMSNEIDLYTTLTVAQKTDDDDEDVDNSRNSMNRDTGTMKMASE